MTRATVLRLGMYAGGVVCIILGVFLSITRHALYAPSLAERQEQGNRSASLRLEELRSWPPLPDHPLYPLRMTSERLELAFESPEGSIERQMRYALDRFASAEILLSRGRYSLALTTLTKSAKYSIQVANETNALSSDYSSNLRARVHDHLSLQKQELTRIKGSFSDEQRAIIDRLIAEIDILTTRL